MLVPSSEKLTKKQLEAKVARDIRDFMKSKGWRALRQQSAMVSRLVAGAPDPAQMFRVGEKGMSDFLFIYTLTGEGICPGLSVNVWVETKRGHGGVLSEDQIQWQEKERATGALVVNASNVQEYCGWYAQTLGWIHDGRAKGQIDLFS